LPNVAANSKVYFDAKYPLKGTLAARIGYSSVSNLHKNGVDNADDFFQANLYAHRLSRGNEFATAIKPSASLFAVIPLLSCQP